MTVKKIQIDHNYQLSLSDYKDVVFHGEKIVLSSDDDYIRLINKGHQTILDLIEQEIPLYGVNTGFGASCINYIHNSDTLQLQENLIRYHGCGLGPSLSNEESLGSILLRLISNAKGYSGIRYKVLKQMERFINIPILPIIPEIGSVGASGDLTPLSYLSATLTGKRKVVYKGKVCKARDALQEEKLLPIAFKPKEALALINGTAIMTAIAANNIIHATHMAQLLEIATAVSVEAIKGNNNGFHPFIHKNKPFPGQIKTAETIFNYLLSSQLVQSQEEVLRYVKEQKKLASDTMIMDKPIQDKYSLRCSPHIIGVLWDTLDWNKVWVEIEMNAVTDNPLINPKDHQYYNGGNFYGGHMAQAMDSLRLCLANCANLIDKQLELLIDNRFNNGLTSNLISTGKGNSFIQHGLKAVQITGTALSSEIAYLAAPISVLSRPTESLNQDVVSLGTISSRYTRNVINLLYQLIAIQFIALCQAMDLRGVKQFSRIAQALYKTVRSISPYIEYDRELDEDIENIARTIKQLDFLDILNKS